MNDKNYFLEKLLSLFLLHGAKTLTMDDIAKEFAVSKKTLYLHYKNKEELLFAILDFISDKIYQEIKMVESEFDCPIESLLQSNERINAVVGIEKNAFITQLIKYYPKVHHDHFAQNQQEILILLANNIKTGQERALYRSDFSTDLYIKFLMGIMYSIDAYQIFQQCTDKHALCNSAIVFYLEAITTEKGKEILNKIK